MIPILFEKNAVDFSTNGLGRLIDCISCKVTEERNGIYELEFVYPITGRFYQTMVDDGGTVCVWHNDQHDIQAFDVYAHSDPMDGRATFYAHHISYRLNRIIVGPFSATSPAEVVSKLSTESVNDNPFTFWTNKSGASTFNLTHPSDIRSLLFGQEGSILDTYGKGEYEFDMFNVKLYVNRGTNTDVTIRYGKNLSDIKKEYDESDICTAIAPYWIGAEGEVVFLPEVIVVSPNIPLQRIPWTDENGNIITDGNGNDIEFSLITRGIIPVPKDFSDSFEEEPTIEQLREKAIAFIDNNEKWVPDENVTVNFVALWQTPEYENVAPLQRLSLCDTVSIFYPDLGIISENQKVIKVVYDVLLERYSEMELGERQASYAETITDGMVTEAVLKTSLNRTSNSIQRILEGEVQHATELITGGLGGYLVIKLNANEQPEELLIMDSPDIESAVNVWRFNRGGLGHSHSGYNGPYNDVALTMDGRINATMISTGILNANLIRAGYLQDANGNNYWNLETGEFRLAALSDYATDAEVASAINTFSGTLTQQEIFNRLTNNGQTQGIYLNNGKLYINATYIKGGTLSLGGSNNTNGILEVLDSNGNIVGKMNNSGLYIESLPKYDANGLITTSNPKYKRKMVLDGGALLFNLVQTTNSSGSSITPIEGVKSEIASYGSQLNVHAPGALRLIGGPYSDISIDVNAAIEGTTRSKNIYFYNASHLVMGSTALCWEAGSGQYYYLAKSGNSLSFYYSANSKLSYSSMGSSNYIVQISTPGTIQLKGNLIASGSKSRSVKTKEYSDRLLYCYETPSPLFGDIGEGQIAEDGACFVWLDPILAQAIATDSYQVFLQKYGEGDAYVFERKPGYFIVKGTPGLAFGWELKAKQADFDQKRLDKTDSFELEPQIDYGTEAASYIIELKEGRLSE